MMGIIAPMRQSRTEARLNRTQEPLVRRAQAKNARLLCCAFLICCLLPVACQTQRAERAVVVYTSVDQIYSEPILKRFEDKTGIRVLPVYDVEATKTTGLVNRLIAERTHPQADLFWSSEFAQTLLLKEEGVLASYHSPAAGDIPAQYRDPEGYWTGLAGRARVLLVNTDLVSPAEYPKSLDDLLLSTQPGGQIGLPYPMFGTSATHAAALYVAWGPERARDWFSQLKARRVRVVDGNSVVRDLVASGQLMLGLTDTDDACGALKKGAPVAIIFLDQAQDGLGTLIIPGTVALVAQAPHPREAQALLDFLASKEVEEELVASGWSHIPLRPTNARPECIEAAQVKGMAVNLTDVFGQLERAKTELSEVFIR